MTPMTASRQAAFAFYLKGDAIILVAADKSGESEKTFCKRLVKTADEGFAQQLEESKKTRRADPMARTLNADVKSITRQET